MENGIHPPAKRRRLNNGKANATPAAPVSPVLAQDGSSSDELAATPPSGHDLEHRRDSWSAKKSYSPQRQQNQQQKKRQQRRRSHGISDSGSPDELAVDADAYWGRTPRNHSTASSPVQSHEPSGNSDQSTSRSLVKSLTRVHSPSEDGIEHNARGANKDVESESGIPNGQATYFEETPEPYLNGDTNSIYDMTDGAVSPVKAEKPVTKSLSPSPAPPPRPPKPDHIHYKEKFVLRGHLRGVSSAKFSPDGTKIASGGADGALKIWDATTGKLIHTFEGHTAGISAVAWSPDGEIVASGSDDKTIRLWNVLTGKAHPEPFIGHHNYVYNIAFSPKGNILVSGSYDEAVFLWDVRSARVMRSLPAHSDPVAGIDVVYDGTLIASCSSDGLIRIWDTGTGQCLKTLVHEDNPPVMGVRFSPNGKFVLAWTLDDCVRLWNYVEGRCIKTYQGHENRKYSLIGSFGIFSAPDGPPEAFAASGSEDGAILCWDVVTKRVLQRLEGHAGAVLGVDTWGDDRRRLMVSCGMDRTIRVWEEAEEVLESTDIDREGQRMDIDDHPREFSGELSVSDDKPAAHTPDNMERDTTEPVGLGRERDHEKQEEVGSE